MKILVVNHAETERLLAMSACIDRMAEALRAASSGQAHQPDRVFVRPPGAKGVMVLMPSYVAEGTAVYGLKTVCVFPGNVDQGLDAHQGSVALFSGDNGSLVALMNASAITAIRTAAVSGVAARMLARPDAGDLAIIGSGIQARRHLEAMSVVRPLRRVRVCSRNVEHVRRFVDEMQSRYSFPIEPVATVDAAVRDADLIVTATTSATPVLRREWVASGAHLSVVGSFVPHAREVDSATIAAASLFVDRRKSILSEAGDYLLALADGAIGPEAIRAEIGEVVAGVKPGRSSRDEITLFKSVGMAIEDLFAAKYVYDQAREQGVGTWVEL